MEFDWFLIWVTGLWTSPQFCPTQENMPTVKTNLLHPTPSEKRYLIKNRLQYVSHQCGWVPQNLVRKSWRNTNRGKTQLYFFQVLSDSRDGWGTHTNLPQTKEIGIIKHSEFCYAILNHFPTHSTTVIP